MKRRPAFRSAPVALRWLALAALIILAPILSGAIPGWWVSRGVVASGTPAPGESDFAALNLGQLKTLAFAAYAELAASGSAGASTGIEDLIKTWCQTDGLGNIQIGANGRPTPRPATSETADFAAVNVGQLKTVAKPFYERLIAIGYVDDFPWAGTTEPASDFAMANVGQAKTLFSFDVRPDADGDGMPDWWERRHGTNPGSASTAGETTIFWAVPNTAAYALGYSRTESGEARLAPRRPNVPAPLGGIPPPPTSGSPTGDIVPRVVLTAHREASLEGNSHSSNEFPLNEIIIETEYFKKVFRTLGSTDSQSTFPALDGDADIRAEPWENDDPRDYGFDNHPDDGEDTDFNGDPDDLENEPLGFDWVQIPVTEFNLNNPNHKFEHLREQMSDMTRRPVSSEGTTVTSFSADRKHPGTQIKNGTFTPLSNVASGIRPYGSNQVLGWMGNGHAGLRGYSASASFSRSDSTILWPEDDDDPESFESHSEEVILQWKQVRMQTNIAPPPGESIERLFTIFRTGDDEAFLGLIKLIIKPGSLVANDSRIYPPNDPTLSAMISSAGGAVTVNLQPQVNAPGLAPPPQVSNILTGLVMGPLPIAVVELSPKTKDEDGNDIAGSEKPNTNSGKPLTPFVEIDPQTNKIAHRELKVMIGSARAGKKVTWTLEALPGATPATIRGEWDDSPTHKDRFEASTAYDASSFRKVSQTTGETTVGADGHTAIRVNVPPIGFNQVRIKIQIEGMSTPLNLIDMEVPAVVVIDPGHGGVVNIGASSANNATAQPSGIQEKAMTLDCAILLRDSLRNLRDQQKRNLKVFMTRSTNVNLSLQARANKAKDNGADIMFSIHFNGNTAPAQVRGTETHIDSTGNFNTTEDTALARRANDAAFGVLSGYDSGARDRGPKSERGLDALSDPDLGNSSSYYPCRGALLELEFIDVPAVDQLLNTNANHQQVRQEAMEAVANALIVDLTQQPAQ